MAAGSIRKHVTALAALAWLGGCGGAGQSSAILYECGSGTRVVAHFERNEVRLTLPGRKVTLTRAPAGSGAKYAGKGVTFWTKGNEALLDTGGRLLPTCRTMDGE
jgi:membrane-bound inhibitor of C-type lysozyme